MKELMIKILYLLIPQGEDKEEEPRENPTFDCE